MRTYLTVLAVGISTLLIGIAVAGPGGTDQVVTPGPTTLSSTLAPWTGGHAPVMLTKMGSSGSHKGGNFHSGARFWGGMYFGAPYLGSGDYSFGTPANQNSCVWNGYKYTCYDLKGNAL